MTEQRKAVLLLLANGVVIAGHTLLAKSASQSGIRPIGYALVAAAGAGIGLAALRRLKGGGRLDWPVAVYGLVAGLVSIALPQALIYSASAYVSAGVASLAYAFPTPLTFVLAALIGIERASAGRTLGIGIAFAGALLLVASRSASFSGEGLWVILAMLAPMSIAAGNIFRTRYWPEGATPLDLALAMSAGAAVWLALGAAGLGATSGPLTAAGVGFLLLAAMLATVGNLIYFELQKTGGIVSFSQIGYVGAVLGLAGGWLILDERYAAPTWIAALVIAAGVAVSEFAKQRAAARVKGATEPEMP